jgi:hypothetical protein
MNGYDLVANRLRRIKELDMLRGVLYTALKKEYRAHLTGPELKRWRIEGKKVAARVRELTAAERFTEAKNLLTAHKAKRPPKRVGRPPTRSLTVRAKHIDDYLLRLLVLRGATLSPEDAESLAKKIIHIKPLE